MLNCRAEISDILHNAPSWGDQAFFWAKCASKLEAGNVREALEYAEVSLSWLLQLLPAKTLGMLGKMSVDGTTWSSGPNTISRACGLWAQMSAVINDEDH